MSETPSQPQGSALVLFSGGQDSATCLAWALNRFARVETVGFDYGQRHAVEMQARLTVLERLPRLKAEWAGRLGLDHTVDLTGFGQISDSALTSDRAIEMDERGLPTSFVPGRNLVFLTDFSGYPDCRRDTLDALQEALRLGMARPFEIVTPLMYLTKGQTWVLAEQIGGRPLVELILEDSHTCYLGERGARHAWGHGCGACPACELRAQGWADYAGVQA